MDSSLPDRSVEENKEDDGALVTETLDLNMLHSKVQPIDEAMNGIVQADLNTEHSRLTLLPVGANDEGLQVPITKFTSPGSSPPSNRSDEHCLLIESDQDHDDADKRSYHTEGLRSPMDDYQTHNEKEGSEYVGLSSELLDVNDNETFSNKMEPDVLGPPTDNCLQKTDDKHDCEVVDNKDFDHQTAKSPTSNELMNGDSEKTEENSNSEKGEVVRVEIVGRICSRHTETKEDYYPTRMLLSDNGGPGGEYSGPGSPERTQNAAPLPDEQLSVSPERSPRTKHSERQEERPSPAIKDIKTSISLSPSKRKRSSSPEKHSVARKRASSPDRSSPSLRRRSPSDRIAHRDSHRRGDSPRKRSSASPRRRESPRRRDRSASRSPVRRRDSSGHKRDYRGRSRSRSPYSRDSHRRSPRRKHSPRHKSPPSGYRSRRRSPRRPWSPPVNRNTGIGRPGNNLFVAGFSYVTTERDLEKKFSRFGRVTDVRIVREKRTGDSRGFGFLSFEKDEDADAAIRAIDQTEWNGRIVLVEKSKTALR